ncbi:MAG: BREX-3 system P-loop-containing protein BrxF [Aurantimonas endophytica]|uniref:BREX-3 system P-loop-containing protein BrxF n=1 Tax=Aurantimonas endophytica TaxID=1522175 RepID=UPI0030016A46
MRDKIDDLEVLVDDISGLNSKLVLLIGPPQSGKSDLLEQLSARRQTRVLRVGLTLSRELLTVPGTRRHFQALDLLKDLAASFGSHGLLLIDNIEILFDRRLQLSPLDLLKRYAHARRVVAVWPGEISEDRLSYATTGHPEHQDYGIDGLVPFKIH